MIKKFLLLTTIITIGVIMVLTLVPASMAASCPTSMTQVDASESPETDDNQNGLICKYERQAAGFQAVVVYQDDII